MQLAFDATGTHDNVRNELWDQIKQARTAHPAVNATLAALHDDLAKRSTHDDDEMISVHVALTIDIVKTKVDPLREVKPLVMGVLTPTVKATPAPSLASFTSPELKPAA